MKKNEFPMNNSRIIVSRILVLVLVVSNTAVGELLPNGSRDDENLSIVYDARSGEVGVDTADRFIGQISIRSASKSFLSIAHEITSPFLIWQESVPHLGSNVSVI